MARGIKAVGECLKADHRKEFMLDEKYGYISQETPGESLENKLQSPTQTGILKGPSHTEQDRQDQHSVHEL